jgi:DNA repair protein RadC
MTDGGLAALRDRALLQGVDKIGDEELASLVSGACGVMRARFSSLESDLPTLSVAPTRDLAASLALSEAEGLKLSAAFALGRRVELARCRPRTPMQSSEAIYRHLLPMMRGAYKERFCIMLLDSKHRLIRPEIVSEGTLTTSLVHPREVFRPAIRESAAAIALAHNHPSGDPEPSADDIAVTRRLLRTGRLVGIPVLDHVVMGHRCWVSLRDRIPFG